MSSVQELLLPILQQNELARNSDEELVREFTKRYCIQELDLQQLGLSVKQIKNILRSRRLIQANNIELRATEAISDKRKVLNASFKATRGNWEI